MSNFISKTYKVTTILFFVGLVVFFIGTLSLMTDLFVLVDYQAYLKPEALVLYNTANELNKGIFDVATFLVAFGSLVMFFKLYRKEIKWVAFIYLMVVITLTIVLTGIYLIQLIDLSQLYQATDISWSSTSNQELLRYTEPSDYWIIFTLISTLVTFILSVINLPFTITHFLKLRQNYKEVAV